MSAGLPAPKRVDIRAIRDRFGLTQADIADELHVDKRTIRRWESGAASPSPMAVAHVKMMQRRLAASKEGADGNGGSSMPPSNGALGGGPGANAGQESRGMESAPSEGLMPRRRLPSL